MMEAALVAAGLVLAVATALPLWRRQSWWVRVCDFPRLQIAVGLLLVLVLHVLLKLDAPDTPLDHALRALWLVCLAWQFRCMYPYTRLARVQVQHSRAPAAQGSLRLLFANVLQTNRRAEGLLAQIRETDPDVVLALETDAWWQEQLDALAATHPHAVRQAQDNTYGMLLYSRIPLIDPEVTFLLQDDVPSIHARLKLASGAEIQLHCLHPRPPAPGEADSSAERDAELLIVGREIKKNPSPVVVMGDLNDVAWSHTSDLFRRISGLLDPRVGRGFFNTFSAHHRWVRYPLDHFFHSNDFRLVDFRRLDAFGSDHFPVYIHLSHEPQAQAAQPENHADAEDRQEAREKIGEVVQRSAN